jgi:hypothetical protein
VARQEVKHGYVREHGAEIEDRSPLVRLKVLLRPSRSWPTGPLLSEGHEGNDSLDKVTLASVAFDRLISIYLATCCVGRDRPH